MAKTPQDQAAFIEKPPKDFYQLLIVDDEPVARRLVRAILAQQGYTTVDEAEDGNMALAALKATAYDLVLLDKNLPGIDGLEVLEQGKRLRPGCEFIMITAYGSMETAIRAMDLGASSYLTKPLDDFEVILARIDRAIETVAIRKENGFLTARLQLALDELERSESRLAQVRSAEGPGSIPERTEREGLIEAIARLRRLAAQLATLHARAQGKSSDLLGKVENEISQVADLLER
jgi:DNA-binding NtrC family response regulator